MYSLYIKFQEKIFTGKRIIQLWNFGNFCIPEIIPKILVTLRFSKISLHELKGNCKCFKMRYWPHFYVDPTHSNTYFSKVGIWRVLLQGTVRQGRQLFAENFVFTLPTLVPLAFGFKLRGLCLLNHALAILTPFST